MKNPIDQFEKIRNFYITYLETAFRISDDRIQLRRRELPREPGTLTTAPYIEPIPRYKPSGLRIDQLVDGPEAIRVLKGFDAPEREAFVRLSSCGLIPCDHSQIDNRGIAKGEFELYQHQIEMLHRGIQNGTPGIVTSGTGSGKTEAFLLPIFATLNPLLRR